MEGTSVQDRPQAQGGVYGDGEVVKGVSSLDTKHPIPEEVEWSVLKTLKHAFTTTTNEYKRNVTNMKFEAELEEILRNDDQYQTKGTLERFLYLCEGVGEASF